MPSWTAPLVGPGLAVLLSRPLDLSVRIAFPSLSGAGEGEREGAIPGEGRAFGLPAATTRPVELGPFVGDVRRGGSCNCETHVITPHGDGTHTEGVGHLLHDRVPVLELIDVGLLPALVVTVAPARLDSVGDDVVGNHAPTDLVVDELALSEAVAKALDGSPAQGRVKARALIVRTAPGALRRAEKFSGANPPYLTVDAASWITGRGFEHLLVDLPSVDREDDGGLLGAHRAFFDVPARATHIHGPPPRRTITEMIAVDAHIADGLYALALQLAPLVADAVPSRPVIFPLVASAPSWLQDGPDEGDESPRRWSTRNAT